MSDVVLRKYVITIQGEPQSIDGLEERLQEALEEAKEEEAFSRASLKQVSEITVDGGDDEEDIDDDGVEDEDDTDEDDE